MEIKGERLIAASRQTVWNAINDPAMLQLCIPGCEKVERVDASQMKAVVLAKIGPVRARFSGKVTMSDIAAPDCCTLHFEGDGGPAGFAKGHARVTLSAQEGDQTLLVFGSSATIGGKLGQIGARLVEAAARTISDQFFDRLAAQLAPPAEEKGEAAALAAGDALQPEGAGLNGRPWYKLF